MVVGTHRSGPVREYTITRMKSGKKLRLKDLASVPAVGALSYAIVFVASLTAFTARADNIVFDATTSPPSVSGSSRATNLNCFSGAFSSGCTVLLVGPPSATIVGETGFFPSCCAEGVIVLDNGIDAEVGYLHSSDLNGAGPTSQTFQYVEEVPVTGIAACQDGCPINETGGYQTIGTVRWSDGTSDNIQFRGEPAPTLSSINSSGGAPGTSVPVTLTGSNFIAGAIAGATVYANNAGITVSNIAVVSATQITATLTIAAGASGTTNVVVFTSGGTSNPVTFTIVPPPTLSSISPSSGVAGTAVGVTLTGTNFVAGATVNPNNFAVSVSNVNVVSATQITATFTIEAGFAGTAGPTVTTSGGTSNSVIFTFTEPTPTLSSISPASGVPGTSVPVTLTGTNFLVGGGSTLMPNNADIAVTNFVVVSATQITATFTIAAGASGAAAVTVYNGGGGGASNPAAFTIVPSPTLTSVNPNRGTAGTNVNVTLTGTNFVSGATTVNVSNGVTVSNVSVTGPTQLTASFMIAASATGSANVSVTTSGGTNGTVPFSFSLATPTLSSVSPNSGSAGTNVNVTLTGTNFVAGATVNPNNAGITVSNLNVASATQITATFTITTGASGPSGVTVTTSGGTSNASIFTINPPTQPITITPTSLNPGQVGVPYPSTAFAAVGGTGGGYTWSESGALGGLSFSGGVLSGTPTTPGLYNPTFTVTDSGSNTKSIMLPLTINPAGISISPTTLSQGTEGAAYAAVHFTATGGTGGGYTWLVSGQPSGLAITPAGVFSGTPGIGTSASSPYTVKVSVTDSGSNTNFVQIPLVIKPPTASSITLSTNSLSFSYVSGGAVPPPQSFGVSGIGGPVNFSVSATSGSNWLIATPPTGTTPANVSVGLQTLASLSPGMYQGNVVVQPQGSLSSQSVAVTLQVASSQPVLGVSSSDLRYSLAAGSAAAFDAIQVTNTGGGTINYLADQSPASWLSITCGTTGSVSAGSPGQICIQVDPTGLQPATYTAALGVTGSGQSVSANITLQVTSSTTSIVLSATAMTFYAIAGSPPVSPPVQSSAVLNGGASTMNWIASLDQATPSASWLSMTSASGSSSAFGASQPAIVFAPNATGLDVGNYYAIVDVNAPGASNSPAQISVLLKILAAGSQLPPTPSASGLIYTAPVGGGISSAQVLTLTSSDGVPLNFTGLLFTGTASSGQQVQPWLNVSLLAGTVPGSGPLNMSLSATPTGLAAGTYYSELRLGFGNGTSENIGVTLLVTPTGSVNPAEESRDSEIQIAGEVSACSTNNVLSFVQPAPTTGGTVVAGQAYILQVKSLCVPQPPTLLQVTISFGANAYVVENQQKATYNATTGYYESSWQVDPRSVGTAPVQFFAEAQVFTANASNPEGDTVKYGVTATAPDPTGSPIPQGVFNSASGAAVNAVATGSFISVYGQQMAAISATANLPYATVLGGVMVTLGGTPLRLYSVNSGQPDQVNAVVPLLPSQTLNTTQSLIVYKNCTAAGTGCLPSSPLPMNMVAIQPAIFPLDANNPPEGAIENANAGYAVADESHPAAVGNTIVIFCEGLGQVANPPAAGVSSSGLNSTLVTPTVFIDGIQAPAPGYSGLAPGWQDLYQVNVVVPPGIRSGHINVYLQMTDPITGQDHSIQHGDDKLNVRSSIL